ncbi:hypothetical protein L915_16178 [Phytophthora nicotianae]|uniref:Uncharacterized protein n=1 Tax=Phytophthora nicotianae TaxID=4792 RepID=W2G3J7_PHYNI|nr:hypothetical protein L915_16178 [Phytophthora nicotianae]
MDSELRTWDLYELSGAVNPDTLEAMKALFRRFRGLRQKGIEGVEYGALQESWCAFVRRWNRMKEAGEDFVAWLNHREAAIEEHSLSELRHRICGFTYHDVHRMCYVHVAEGCDSCLRPRPTEEEWRAHIVERPLGEDEKSWIQRYRRSLSEFARSVNIAGSRWRRPQRSRSPPMHRGIAIGNTHSRSRSRSRGRLHRRSHSPARGRRSQSRSHSFRPDYWTRQASSRSLEQRPEHPGGDWIAAPTYRPSEISQASEP